METTGGSMDRPIRVLFASLDTASRMGTNDLLIIVVTSK